MSDDRTRRNETGSESSAPLDGAALRSDAVDASLSSASDGSRMKRRDALKAMATTAVAVPLAGAFAARPAEGRGRALPVVDPSVVPDESAEGAGEGAPPLAGPRGTPSDPDLLHPKVTWTMKLTASEMITLTALCDLIIPADAKSPSASAVGVPAYINEYVSAPAESYQKTLVQVRGGLAWLDVESKKRFGKRFGALSSAQRTQIGDDICYVPKAKPEYVAAARFFDRVRDLTAEGFYTTDAGMKDIGYVGNVAMLKFDGAPPEVLKHLGLA